MQHAFDKQVTTLSHTLEILPTSEKVYDFTLSSMHVESEPTDFEASSGNFLKKNFKVSKYCGSTPANCFTTNYTKYTNSGKTTVKPLEDFKGSCAILKNGMSICIRPQVGTGPVEGWIDTNGKHGPNVIDRDMRKFSIDPKGGFKVTLGSTSEIWDTDINCKVSDPNSPLSCCNRWEQSDDWNNLSNEKKTACCNREGVSLEVNSTCCKFFKSIPGGFVPASCDDIDKCDLRPHNMNNANEV